MYSQMGGEFFPQKGPGQLVAMAMSIHQWILVTKQPLCERSVMRGHMCEAPTLTPQGFDIGQPVLLFWRYVDTDVKDDPSGGW